MTRESTKPVTKCDVNCYYSETIPRIEQITSYITETCNPDLLTMEII